MLFCYQVNMHGVFGVRSGNGNGKGRRPKDFLVLVVGVVGID